MSLTSQLKSTTSPISIYFRENFDMLDNFLKEDQKVISECQTLTPENSKNYPWMDVGHVVEYLFQINLGVKVQDLFPMLFLYKANSTPATNLYNRAVKAFYYNVDPDNPTFAEQMHVLYSLALYEDSIRSRKPAKLGKFFAPIEVINDVANIWLYVISKNCYYGRKDKIIYNPTFSLSREVGGADADFIRVGTKDVGNTLIDLKTTINTKIRKEWIYQLLGYVFLDKLGYYKLKNVEIFLPRQNAMLRWKVEEIIVNSSSFPSTRKAKAGFMEALNYIPSANVMGSLISSLGVQNSDNNELKNCDVNTEV